MMPFKFENIHIYYMHMYSTNPLLIFVKHDLFMKFKVWILYHLKNLHFSKTHLCSYCWKIFAPNGIKLCLWSPVEFFYAWFWNIFFILWILIFTEFPLLPHDFNFLHISLKVFTNIWLKLSFDKIVPTCFCVCWIRPQSRSLDFRVPIHNSLWN